MGYRFKEVVDEVTLKLKLDGGVGDFRLIVDEAITKGMVLHKIFLKSSESEKGPYLVMVNGSALALVQSGKQDFEESGLIHERRDIGGLPRLPHPSEQGLWYCCVGPKEDKTALCWTVIHEHSEHYIHLFDRTKYYSPVFISVVSMDPITRPSHADVQLGLVLVFQKIVFLDEGEAVAPKREGEEDPALVDGRGFLGHMKDMMIGAPAAKEK